MHLNRLGTFTLGVIITAVSVGAVSFANATGDKTLKACANKTTGAMRYIAKGSCKKTEQSLSWNQMGPTGLPGPAGLAGAKGDTGTPGASGQTLHVIDDKGQDLGLVISHDQSEITVLLKDKIWDLNIYESNRALGNLNGYEFFTDALCAKESPVVRFQKSPAQSILNMAGRHWTITSIVLLSNQPDIYELINGQCKRLNAVRIAQLESEGFRMAVVQELETLTYTAPLTIVAK